jgi:hypothetical protein
VVVTCSSTVDDSEDGTNFNYGDTITMLREQSITLHHLTGEKLRFKMRKKSSDKILGFSEDRVFFSGSSSSSSGLRRQIRPPKDLVSALSAESSGSVFQLREFGTVARKEAGMALAGEVAGAVSRPVRQSICRHIIFSLFTDYLTSIVREIISKKCLQTTTMSLMHAIQVSGVRLSS